AAGRVGLNDALTADDVAGGREIGPRNQSKQLFQLLAARHRGGVLGAGEVRVLDQPDAAADHLAQVVRRHVGGHADGNPGRSVDEEVRERRWQYGRLFGGLVVFGTV